MIEYIDIRGWDRDKWVAWRDRGIGGSETGGVHNQSKWDDALKIYLNKIGEPITTFTGNRFTKFGQFDEPHLAYLYQFWDGNAHDQIMNMFANEEAKKKINTVRSVFAYVVNSKYPWLFASMDRRILRNRKLKKGRGVLECKNTTSMEKNTYKYGINPAHVLQVYTYLMITEWEFAEVAIGFDGNNYEVIEFEPDKEIFESIQYVTAKFWQSVEKARKIKIDYDVPSYYGLPDYYFTTSKQMDGIAILQALEPDITPVTYDWIKDLVKPTPEYTEMAGTQKIFELAVQYHKTMQDRGVQDTELDRLKACLIAELSGIHVAKFEDGNVSYKPTTSGANRLHISTKLIE